MQHRPTEVVHLLKYRTTFLRTFDNIPHMKRPDIKEYDPYYETYVSLVSGDDVMPLLETQMQALRPLIDPLAEEKGTLSYADGKWTVKELLSHIIDGERIFAYRILRISRGDQTPIEGFEQDGYIENSNANNRLFSDLLDELEHQRQANLRMLKNLSEADAERLGTASEKTVSVRALAYIMAGHVEHHIQILKDRYLI